MYIYLNGAVLTAGGACQVISNITFGSANFRSCQSFLFSFLCVSKPAKESIHEGWDAWIFYRVIFSVLKTGYGMFFPLIHFFVITEPPVTVTHPLVGGSVSEGEVARLECKLSSETEERVTWFKGKEQIQAGGRYEILSDGKKQILIIHAFKPEDQDTYTCMVSPEVKSVASLCLEGTVSAFP